MIRHGLRRALSQSRLGSAARVRGHSKQMGSAGSAGAPVKRSALWEDPEPFTLPGKKSPGLLAHARVAGLAHGAVFGRDGDTIVLATVVSDRRDEVAVGDGGTPLNVDCRPQIPSSALI